VFGNVRYSTSGRAFHKSSEERKQRRRLLVCEEMTTARNHAPLNVAQPAAAEAVEIPLQIASDMLAPYVAHWRLHRIAHAVTICLLILCERAISLEPDI
jgi:hypothetical protein